MSESGDFAPAPHWEGYDFASARKAYADHVDRSYADAVSKGVAATDLVPEQVATDCEAPLVICCDVTGSMGEWPATIFSKLPYLEHEGQEYLGQDMEISFCAIGDAFSDQYPLQVRPFVRGAELKTSLEALVHEKGGGGTSEESYDLAALYYARHCHTPKAIRTPILIIVGDEGVYGFVDREKAQQHAHVELSQRLETKALFSELRQKFRVYVVRKPYGSSSDNAPSPAEKRIREQWSGLLGDGHVVSLPEASRVVDVIFGILAQETGRVDYFVEELRERQGKDEDGAHKIDVVLKSVRAIHSTSHKPALAAPDPAAGKSVTRREADQPTRKAAPLLDAPAPSGGSRRSRKSKPRRKG